MQSPCENSPNLNSGDWDTCPWRQPQKSPRRMICVASRSTDMENAVPDRLGSSQALRRLRASGRKSEPHVTCDRQNRMEGEDPKKLWLLPVTAFAGPRTAPRTKQQETRLFSETSHLMPSIYLPRRSSALATEGFRRE